MQRDLERENRDEEEPQSRIDAAKDSLYRPGAPEVIRRTHDMSTALPEEEMPEPSKVFAPPPVAKTFDSSKITQKVNQMFRKLLVAAVLFFVVAVIGAVFMYFYGNNIISASNIRIEFTAPPSVPSSDTFSFDISVQNGNSSDLLDTVLIVDYPEGTRYIDDNTKPLVSERIDLGTLAKGSISKRTVNARLFGEENSEKNIRVRLQYRVEGSDAAFTKEEDFNVVLSLAPIVFSVDALREVNNNEEVTLRAKVISNSNNTLNNVALNVVYPFGFTYALSNLEVESGQRGEFPIGELKPNETKTVEITGTITGQSAEDKVFKFSIGTADPSRPEKVSTILAAHTQQMSIRSDFLASAISFDSNRTYGELGKSLRGTINWRNTLEDPINDARFSMRVSGDLINEEDVRVDKGFFDSGKSIIEWNKNTSDNLEELVPGQSGQFDFVIPFFSYENAISEKITNPKMNLSLDIEGQRVRENNVTETIKSSFSKSVPIVTKVDLAAFSLRDTGPLQNSGSHPAKAENKSTYTVQLSLSNAVNEVTNSEVTLKLPTYVKYEGEISPKSESVLWNESTHQLRWNVGSLPVRVGHGTTPRTLYFKVSVTPSRTQIGDILQLANSVTFTGRDSFAATDLKVVGPNVTTAAKDKGTSIGNGQVVE